MLSVYVKNRHDLENLPEVNLYVVFDDNFDDDVKLPSKTKELKIGEKFNKNIILPEGLTHLRLFTLLKNLNYPSTIKYLKISHYNRYKKMELQLSEGLTHLILPNDWSQKLDNLPSTILYLELGNQCNVDLNNLPLGLEVLVFGRHYFGNLINLPITLKEIKYKDYLKLDKVPFNCKIIKIK